MILAPGREFRASLSYISLNLSKPDLHETPSVSEKQNKNPKRTLKNTIIYYIAGGNPSWGYSGASHEPASRFSLPYTTRFELFPQSVQKWTNCCQFQGMAPALHLQDSSCHSRLQSQASLGTSIKLQP